MQTVRMTRDMRPLAAGDTYKFPDAVAQKLVDEGAATLVATHAPAAVAPPAPEKTPNRYLTRGKKKP